MTTVKVCPINDAACQELPLAMRCDGCKPKPVVSPTGCARSTSPSREAFEAAWPRIVIPGEFDGMDSTDKSRWSGALLQAFEFGIQHARDVAVKACKDTGLNDTWCFEEAIKEALK